MLILFLWNIFNKNGISIRLKFIFNPFRLEEKLGLLAWKHTHGGFTAEFKISSCSSELTSSVCISDTAHMNYSRIKMKNSTAYLTSDINTLWAKCYHILSYLFWKATPLTQMHTNSSNRLKSDTEILQPCKWNKFTVRPSNLIL